jgi:DNA-binding CsgD family transcriptional regulator
LYPKRNFRTLTDAVNPLALPERRALDRRAEKPDTLNLMAREGSAKDLVHCHGLHRSFGLPYTKACAHVLPEMWRTLLASGSMQLFLVEDRARPLDSRIISFSATVFATDGFCREARSTLPPYLGVQVARRYLSRDLPVLNREQVARANAREGLSVVLSFAGWEQNALWREQILAVREKQSEAFQIAHSGYRVKEFIAEPIGEEALRWMVESGAHLRRDYADDFQRRGVPIPKPSQRPWLVGLTKEEALARPGSYLSSFFVHTPPRFHFNRSEQTLLRHALMGKTCEELATSLFISPWTVKKRWRAIYERVADVDRELLLSIANSPDTTSRGAERRRHLLHYLRQHLEELRPSSP